MMTGAGNDEQGDLIQPDPLRGRLGDGRYAEHYARSHAESSDSLAYRSNYIDILTLDVLMAEGYSLLDVGCGTGGYHRLLARQGLVHGIDPIPEMIAIAKRFQEEFDLRECRYSCTSFEDMPGTEPYDVIRARGVYGWYLPWRGRESVLEKIAGTLKPSGVAVVSYVPPSSLFGIVKALVAPLKTVLIFRRRFWSMLRAVGLEPLFEMKLEKATIVFARKSDDHSH